MHCSEPSPQRLPVVDSILVQTPQSSSHFQFYITELSSSYTVNYRDEEKTAAAVQVAVDEMVYCILTKQLFCSSLS